MIARRDPMRTCHYGVLLWCVGLLAAVNADANIGCLFSSSLCDDRLEWCYDDHAFGRCLPMFGEMDRGEMYHFDLDQNDLNELETEMQRLFSLGYRWSHPLTQCVLKELLAAVKHRLSYDSGVCLQWAEPMLESPTKGLEDEAQRFDPQNMAFVRYQPSAGNPHPDFADEVYFPPLTEEDVAREMVLGEPRVMELNAPPPRPNYNVFSEYGVTKKSMRSYNDPMRSALLPPSAIFTSLYNTPDKFRGGMESRDGVASIPELLSKSIFQPAYNTPDKFRQGFENKDSEDLEEALRLTPPNKQEQYLTDMGYTKGSNLADDYRQAQESADEEVYFHDRMPQPPPPEMTLEKILKESRDNNDFPLDVPREATTPPGRPRLSPKMERLANLLYSVQEGEGKGPRATTGEGNSGAAYTEGGLVFLPNQNQADPLAAGIPDEDLDDGLDALLGPGFKRPERLDVKKPGPQFTMINLAEQHHAQQEEENASKLNLSVADANSKVAKSVQGFRPTHQEKMQSPAMIKKAPDNSRPTPDAGQYDVVDTTFAYIGFKQSLKSWHEGRNIVRYVTELLGLPPGTLSHSRVDRNEVTFRVEPNVMQMNSSEVARRIESIKDKLKTLTGVEVTSAGIGDKTKLPTVLPAPATDYDLYISVFLVCGVALSLTIAGTTLFFLRRNAKSREKLQGLSGADTEAVGDYQALCRARMAGKGVPEKAEAVGHRIASLSRESESNNSPSSRSSTSSWSEEPALTNMDISTGHMVLSYMEDHLRNKDRLDQEWVALCAYEAEPCAATQAQKTENANKNRYADIVPYDHSRVVLNDLANISGGDYINASTITDHDPRSPAYIATQGPLPQTAPHFWQLVWEQGSVVMVMLTRLTENGAAMCHRYWPEEGSELYHIYEVHLVSEHIWCDDYLVRSFYLKNLKTGETRTVTQFHFLSWPDNGVPTSTKALLEFRRKVNKSYRGRSCPIIVHCSDGIGRTGTYCLIDMVLNRMAKGAKEIDIAATLEHIRDQRAAMVKTREQFEFVLKAVAEEVNAILKALPPQQSQPAVTAPPPVQPPQ